MEERIFATDTDTIEFLNHFVEASKNANLEIIEASKKQFIYLLVSYKIIEKKIIDVINDQCIGFSFGKNIIILKKII
jgi:hypothetical protein